MAEEIKETAPVVDAQSTETVPEPQKKTYSEEEYNALRTQLESLEKSAKDNEDFKKKKDNEDFKKKFEQSEKDRKEFEYQTQLTGYVKSLGLVDDIYEEKLATLLKSGGAKFKDGKALEVDATLTAFKEKYPQAFKSAKIPRFVDNTQGKTTSVAEDTLRKIMGLPSKK